ncbi:hypothetical protein SLE2022_198850 [Rubroshorea leprosula]
MGNQRFRFSDMIPNAWFYKLKNMGRTRNNYPKASPSHSNPINKKPLYPSTAPQNFNYFTKDAYFPDSTIISSRRKARRRRTIYRPSPKATLNSLSPFDSESEADDHHHFAPESCDDHQVLGSSDSNSCYKCKLTSSTTDIIIDMMNNESCRYRRKLTKPAESSNYKNKEKRRRVREAKARRSLSFKIVKEESIGTHETRKSTTGIKVRANSLRIASNKIHAAYARKSISSGNIAESFAVVKSSVDPQKDFRDSMVEMIVENNIRASKDLEQLLACYLSLNSREYHHLIIKAFEQIWFDLTN